MQLGPLSQSQMLSETARISAYFSSNRLPLVLKTTVVHASTQLQLQLAFYMKTSA